MRGRRTQVQGLPVERLFVVALLPLACALRVAWPVSFSSAGSSSSQALAHLGSGVGADPRSSGLHLRGAGMTLAAEGGSYPPRARHKVRGYIGGKSSFTAIAAAVDAAKESVFATICFHDPKFRFPDGRTLVELVRSAAIRNVKVCVLVWDNPDFKSGHILRQSDSRQRLMQELEGVENIAFRWHYSPQPAHCHHMKAWVIDVAVDEVDGDREVTGVAFIGSANLQMATINEGHASETSTSPTVHDTYLAVEGPCAMDILDLCRKRWVSAASVQASDISLHRAAVPSEAVAEDLTPRTSELVTQHQEPLTLSSGRCSRSRYPGNQITSSTTGSLEATGLVAQVVSTVMPGVISCDQKLSNRGEASVLEAYLKAIDAAERSIFIENQHLFHDQILDSLRRACERGVEVLCLVPGSPMAAVVQEKAQSDKYSANPSHMQRPRYHEELTQLADMGKFPNFNLAVLLAPRATAEGPALRSIYIHSKVAIIDGVWVTAGSTNIVDLSLDRDHTEVNVVCWSEALAMQLLATLCNIHSGGLVDTAEGDVRMVQALSHLARANGHLWENGVLDFKGYPVSVPPGAYASHDYLLQLRKQNQSS